MFAAKLCTLSGYIWLKLLAPCLMSLKSSRNKKDFDDVIAAPFLVSFSQLPAAKKHRKRAAVTSLRSSLFRDDFSNWSLSRKWIETTKKVINIEMSSLEFRIGKTILWTSHTTILTFEKKTSLLKCHKFLGFWSSYAYGCYQSGLW